MPDGADVVREGMDALTQSQVLANEYGRLGRKLAVAEREYRRALAQYMLRERAAGTPVTILPDLARGDDEVSRLRFDRDIAQADYDACRESLLVQKKRASIYESVARREWFSQGN